MLPAEDLFVCVYVLIDDLISARVIAIPPRPGPAPACSDAGLLAIAQVRHLLGCRSEAGFLAEVARDWAHLFPHLPRQSEASRRIRWLRGAFEQLRCHLAGQGPMGCTPGSAATPRTPNGSTASGWPSRPAWAAASSGRGASCPPP